MKQKKFATIYSKEYITVKLDASEKIQVFVTTSDFENSATKDFYTAVASGFQTVDVSFPLVAAKFPEIDPDTIIAYRMVLPSEIAVFIIDRNNYVFPLQFRYLNSFDVPDTIITRGAVARQGETSFETAKIGGLTRKFNVERNDTFSVMSGKIFSFNEYDRYREMFNSDDVEVFFHGKWRGVVVEEDSNDVLQVVSNLKQISFSFRFSDDMDNNIIIGESFTRWILENGTWQDGNMWIDPGEWND